jgi:hypothetical protein
MCGVIFAWYSPDVIVVRLSNGRGLGSKYPSRPLDLNRFDTFCTVGKASARIMIRKIVILVHVIRQSINSNF